MTPSVTSTVANANDYHRGARIRYHVREEIPAQPKPVAQVPVVEEPPALSDDEDIADNPFEG